MEDLGNLVYILAAVAYLLYNGWKSTKGKAKKQQTRQQRSPDMEEPTPQTITLEDILRGRAQETAPKPVARPISKVEKVRVKEEGPVSPPVRRPVKTKRNRIPALDEAFSLRKAVIYDVIMKRVRH